jgi:SWI/SNF-related matrix-associated actin-dependent regulator of chromatin subfamily A3
VAKQTGRRSHRDIQETSISRDDPSHEKILDLPSRGDKIIRLPFSEAEKQYYLRIEHPVVDMLDHTAERNGTSIPWMTAIQQINKLRLVCNLGTYLPSRQPWPIQAGGTDSASAILVARLSIEGETCLYCLLPIESPSFGNELDSSTALNVYYSVCHRFYCADCAELLRYQALQPCDCTNRLKACSLQQLMSFLLTPNAHTDRQRIAFANGH